MELKFQNLDYECLFNGTKTMKFHPNLIKAFQKKIQVLSSSPNINDLYALKSLHLEKLEGNKEGRLSIRLNNQWRLVFKMLNESGTSVVLVKGIEDYH